MAHKDFVRLRDSLTDRHPRMDLNGDGVADPVVQGHLSKDACDKIEGCAFVDGYAFTPMLKNGFDEPVPFSRAPASLGRLFGKAAAFVFTQSTFNNRTLRFFPDDPDGGRFENPASFSVGQMAGYFDRGGKFVSFKIEGFAVGLMKQDAPDEIRITPSCDAAGRPIRIAYGRGADGKRIEKPLHDLVWATPDGGQAIDPHVLVSGGTSDRPLSEAEAQLLPLFAKAREIELACKKMQLKETGARDLRAVRLTSLEVRRKARDDVEAMLRTHCPRTMSADFALWDGLRVALGKAAGLRRADLTVPSIQE